MAFKERIQKLMAHYALNATEFADEIEVQRSSVSHITSGRNKPSLDFIMKIKERFPEIEWDWLIKGQGQMIVPPEVQKKNIRETAPDLFDFMDNKKESHFFRDPTTVSDTKNPKLGKEYRLFSPNSAIKKEINSEISNAPSAIKRVLILYENGKFDSYEP
ncbi:MAG: helix-turn-helix transcriptional regulator [Bergeyella sp.]|nr:helix-turn-helix transcriptional regulator [Bergeyella sp.]